MSMTQHPLSAAFPPMARHDCEALINDLALHGQRDPITIFEDMVLDGWHRWQSLEHLGISPRCEDLPEGADPVAFVLSRNMHRRHLDASQRAVAVATCRQWTPVGKPKRNVEPSSTLSEMAKEANVSERTIRDAKAVINAGRADEVMEGRASVKSIARPSKPDPAPVEIDIEIDAPDLVAELEQVHNENLILQKLVDSLTQSDLGKEVASWKGKFDAVNGRINQMLTTDSEQVRTLKYQSELLAKIRKLLGIEKSSQIISTLTERLGL